MEIEFYENPLHAQNVYLHLHGGGKMPDADAFRALRARLGRPLQILLSSDDPLCAHLAACGFVRRRACFEMRVTAADLVRPLPAPAAVRAAVRGEAKYAAACALEYDYYRTTHAGVNPLTCGAARFASSLPDDVIYLPHDADGIACAAFVEGKEIAYLCTRDGGAAPAAFTAAVLSRLFAAYGEITFEADDTDPAATALRALFRPDGAPSWDTYIFDPKEARP